MYHQCFNGAIVQLRQLLNEETLFSMSWKYVEFSHWGNQCDFHSMAQFWKILLTVGCIILGGAAVNILDVGVATPWCEWATMPAGGFLRTAGSIFWSSIALKWWLFNIVLLFLRACVEVKIHSKRACPVEGGVTEWTTVKWGTSSSKGTELLHNGQFVFSSGTVNLCHSCKEFDEKNKCK